MFKDKLPVIARSEATRQSTFLNKTGSPRYARDDGCTVSSDNACNQTIISDCEEPTRLDRWLRRKFPQLSVSAIQKLIRKKLIKVNGKKPAVDARIVSGDEVKLPRHCEKSEGRRGNPRLLKQDELPRSKAPRDDTKYNTLLTTLKNTIIYKDENILVLNKPAGLATQGGSKVKISIDDLAEGLKFELPNKPKLVHRLDKDTSGILILARTQRAATLLTRAFATGQIVKKYWAVVVGRPAVASGVIDLPIAKGGSHTVMSSTGPVVDDNAHQEKMQINHESGKRAITQYRTLGYIGEHATLLEMIPITGRTHQLRIHAASLGTPILGDGKYGGKSAFIPGLSNKLHLHAREVVINVPVLLGQKLSLVSQSVD